MTEPMTFEAFKSYLANIDLDGIYSEHTYSTLKLVKLFNASGSHERTGLVFVVEGLRQKSSG